MPYPSLSLACPSLAHTSSGAPKVSRDKLDNNDNYDDDEDYEVDDVDDNGGDDNDDV